MSRYAAQHDDIDSVGGNANPYQTNFGDEKKGVNGSDAEVTTHAAGPGGDGEPIVGSEPETLRSLKPRQISMIAIGGAIGAYRSTRQKMIMLTVGCRNRFGHWLW